MDTALTIITDALSDIGVLADGETPTPSQAQGALRKLNNLLEAWNLSDFMVYGASSYVCPFVAGKGIYSIGSGGDINISRPDQINSAYVRDTTQALANQADYKLNIFNDAEWADVIFKNQQAAWPNWGVWFDYTNPLIQAYMNPVPTSSQYELVIWVSGMISSFAINDAFSLAPGYKRAITANLAIELTSSYQVPIPQGVALVARESVADIRVQNFQMNTLETPGPAQYDAPSNRVYIR